MITLERAKKFFQRIDWWSGSNSYKPGYMSTDFTEWTAPRLWCQIRVARALIRQEIRYYAAEIPKDPESHYLVGAYDGLRLAICILDAVYGRDQK